MRQHPYSPGFSWGNVISVIAILGGGVVVWVALQTGVARADEKITGLQSQVVTDRETTTKRLDTLQAQINTIDQKANTMGQRQAALLANIELLMRAQGLKPVQSME